jgi:hypothetical protein
VYPRARRPKPRVEARQRFALADLVAAGAREQDVSVKPVASNEQELLGQVRATCTVSAVG